MEEFNAFGRAITDFYNGEKAARIIVHSKGLPQQSITGKQLFRTVPGLPLLEKEAMVRCKGKILDIGAGAGSHALILQEMGLDVTALEISAEAVEVMQKRGVTKVMQMDIFQLKDEKFDTLLLLMNAIGLARRLNDLEFFLSHLKSLLNPGGQIIAESSDLLFFADEEEEEAALKSETYYGEIEYELQYKGETGKPFNWLFVDFHTLRKHASKVNLNIELLFEDMEGGYLVRLWEELDRLN